VRRLKPLRLVNSTVTLNTSERYGAVAGVGKTMVWADSIVAGNTTTDPPGAECFGNVKSRGVNLVGSAGHTVETIGCDVRGGPALIGVDPLLGPLAANGGPTETHALLAGSPAIDAGDPRPPADRGTRCPTLDQRGVARNGICDIGAFEF
jgi:hypothetical protein